MSTTPSDPLHSIQVGPPPRAGERATEEMVEELSEVVVDGYFARVFAPAND